MWFWLSLIALLCWSGSDLFSKIGCRDADDHLAHLKMVIAVGVVMGLHAAYEIFIGGVSVTWHVIWTYLPVSPPARWWPCCTCASAGWSKTSAAACA